MASKGHVRHTVWLNPDDFETLAEMYPNTPVSAILRHIIEEHIKQFRPRSPAPRPTVAPFQEHTLEDD